MDPMKWNWITGGNKAANQKIYRSQSSGVKIGMKTAPICSLNVQDLVLLPRGKCWETVETERYSGLDTLALNLDKGERCFIIIWMSKPVSAGRHPLVLQDS